MRAELELVLGILGDGKGWVLDTEYNGGRLDVQNYHVPTSAVKMTTFGTNRAQ